jgi:hypothetical protein
MALDSFDTTISVCWNVSFYFNDRHLNRKTQVLKRYGHLITLYEKRLFTKYDIT